ncbi:MAG: PEGA domain-containing protein [Treponema sp.]|nr:PEGA domain-containing protein [Treponema sp.]
MRSARSGATALLLALLAAPVPARTDLPAWTFGVASMPPTAREVRTYPALGSLPLLVLENLRDLELRFLSDEEAAKILETARLQGLYEAGASAARLRDQRDAAALSPSGLSEQAAQERKLRVEQSRGREEGAASGEIGTRGDTTRGEPRRLALWEGHVAGRLLEAGTDPGGTCAREKLEYLVFWEVSEISGYLRIRMLGWNAVLGRQDFSYTSYRSPEDISSGAPELAQALVRAVSGRPSSRLVFEVEPPDATVRVDGRLLAPGRRSLRVYEEREYQVSLETAAGLRSDYRVRSEFGKDVTLSARLEAPQSAVVLVETDPPGATVHLDGIWAGTTPGEARLFGYARVARLALPGFEDEYRVIEPNAEGRLLVQLREADSSGTSAFERSKERFYQALGLLAVSLPVTLLSYGVFLQSSALYQEDPGNGTFSGRKDAALVAFAVSGGITAGLLAGASIRLVKYIQSAR